MDASLREENTDRVHQGHINWVENPDFPKVGVSLSEELREQGLLELLGYDCKHLVAFEERVDELIEAGVLIYTVLRVLEEEVMPQGLSLAHHHVLHPIQSFRGTEKKR